MKFSELIKREETLLMRLLPVSMKQHDLALAGDITQLNQLLFAQQPLMTEWEANEEQLKPFRSIPPEERQWDSEEERLETIATNERCKVLRDQIMELIDESFTDVGDDFGSINRI